MKCFTGRWSLCIFMFCAQWHATAGAEEKPLWELGPSLFAVKLPSYRGAAEMNEIVLPAPYVVYRGEFFKADKDGARGVFFNSDRFEINLGIAASPPVNSDKIRVRRAMPDLRPTLELGPSIDIKLWESPKQETKVRVLVPIRTAFTVESNPQSIGWQVTPRLNLDVRNPFGLQSWTLGMVGGPVYGSSAQHTYFYGVAPQYSNKERPAYEARAGYAGFQLLTALWKRYPTFWVGGFVRYDDVRGAVFENSPLVTQKSGFSGGIAVSWVIDQSSQMVSVD